MTYAQRMDDELETARASYLSWRIDRISDPASPEHGRLQAARGAYTVTVDDLPALRRSVIEWETGRGLTGEPIGIR